MSPSPSFKQVLYLTRIDIFAQGAGTPAERTLIGARCGQRPLIVLSIFPTIHADRFAG